MSGYRVAEAGLGEKSEFIGGMGGEETDPLWLYGSLKDWNFTLSDMGSH